MYKGIANLLAKLALKRAGVKMTRRDGSIMNRPIKLDDDVLPPPDALKFLLPPAKDLTGLPFLPPKGGLTPAMFKQFKKHDYSKHPAMRALMKDTYSGKIRNIFRGETMFPDKKFISEAGLESGKKPGTWWSTSPWESADYAIRPSKGIMGAAIDNPGVMRRIPMNRKLEDLPEGFIRGKSPTHIHPTQEAIDNSKISMVYSVVNRLREMGWSKGQIFKYVRMIMNKKNAAGKRDWMLYNSGGKV